MSRIVVVGPIGRDLVVRIPSLPSSGGTGPATSRREMVGGKGVNLAVACRQLGALSAVIGAVGDDDAGRRALEDAAGDGVDVTGVVTRHGSATALFIDLLEPGGRRRVIEHVPAAVDLHAKDVTASADLIRSADAVILPLSQPQEVVRAVVDIVRDTSALLVVDGAPADDDMRDHVVECADVVRADAHEFGAYAIGQVDSTDPGQLIDRARRVLTGRPRVVAFGVDGGDTVVWEGGHRLVRHGSSTVDPTGAGDSYVAALTVALLSGEDASVAGSWASAASGDTAGREGARPSLDLATVKAAASSY